MLEEEIKHLADIPLTVQARLECCASTVGEILALEVGSVIRTRRAAGDNVDVHVGEAVIAQGEVLVMGHSLAVRLSDFTENT